MLGDDLEIVERCRTPRGEIQLQRRGAEYEIISNGTFLMATYNGESERLLVKAALDAIDRRRCSVLIGGLGVGYSLNEAIRDRRTEQVTVVEIEIKIMEWNRSYLARFSDDALNHSKTVMIHADLVQWLSGTRETYDAICLDIDNGPDWTVYRENDGLYGDDGLKSLGRRLKPNGVISFWSASRVPRFMERLKLHFSAVEQLAVQRNRSAEPDMIYVARL